MYGRNDLIKKIWQPSVIPLWKWQHYNLLVASEGRRFLLKASSGLPLIFELTKTVFPAVDIQLEMWRHQANGIVDDLLRAQALSSIEKKRFHCLGGSVYALYPSAIMKNAISFIVAFQTISDYLDNLCDRAGVEDETSFYALHQAMIDAVDPADTTCDYYQLYPYKNDGGYLNSLVEACKTCIRNLPSFSNVSEKMRLLVKFYCALQCKKHVKPSLREEVLMRWAEPLAEAYPNISVWEFCAASGSTLGVFMLFAAAQNVHFTVSQADAIFTAYFPWVGGLHILLDYFIDAEEDRLEGDFNFTYYYESAALCTKRLAYFAREAQDACRLLQFPAFHITVIQGLCAMYLSDSKALSYQNKHATAQILKQAGCRTQLYYKMCGLLRKMEKL